MCIICMSVIVYQPIEIICFETMRNIHMALSRGMANNLSNNERAIIPWSKKNCNVHVRWQNRKRARAHFARRRKSVRSMLTCASDLWRKTQEKSAKKTMKRINQSAARAPIKSMLPTTNKIDRNTNTTLEESFYHKLSYID